MKTYLVVTLTCPDRPGIVEMITDVIAKYSANWEESRMARLGGDFAGIVKIGVDTQGANVLAEALRALANDEMTVQVKSTAHVPSDVPQGTALYELRLEGADHEGIVHNVARYLAGHGINVEAMETELVRAPMSASPLFHMVAQVNVPANLSHEELSANLDRIGEDMGVTIEVFRSES